MSFFNSPIPFNVLVGLGKVPGVTGHVLTGVNNTLSNDSEEDIWDQGGVRADLSGATTLFISSSSAADTGGILLTYLDTNYIEKTALQTLSGQSQVSIATDVFIVQGLANASAAELQGSVYIAESDTLTAGVPDTASKIQGKIPFFAANLNRSANIARSALYTVPAGHALMPINVNVYTGKNEDIDQRALIRTSRPGPWFDQTEASTFQTQIQAFQEELFVIPEKTDIRFTGTTQINNTTMSIVATSYLIDLSAIDF